MKSGILFFSMMLVAAVASADEPVYDKYDVRGLNRVAEIQLDRIAFTNKDVPHIQRVVTPEPIRNDSGAIPERSEAEKQVAFSKCVRGIIKTKRYQAIVQKSDGWADPAALRMEKSIAWQEENDKCLEAAR